MILSIYVQSTNPEGEGEEYKRFIIAVTTILDEINMALFYIRTMVRGDGKYFIERIQW